ncbi:MAG: alanine racemase [Pseudolabrys sp.]|nr:alanine racemase [Pseudolabrys sp.]
MARELPSVDLKTAAAPVAEGLVAEGPAADEAGGTLTIDLTAITANWRALMRRALPAECAAVIKADAYGCGIERVAPALEKAGCTTFFVADLSEARRLRHVTQSAAVYVLNGLLPGTAASFAAINVRPVIGSLVELAEWDAFVSSHNWRGGAALHVDTGMNRLGVTPNEAAAIASRIRAENHGITLLMSHLVAAQVPDHPLNDKQLKLFREIRVLYRGIASSIANSSGIFLGPNAHCDMVRPGAALFGVNPTPGKNNPMRAAIDLRGKVVGVRSVQRNESVGYDAGWIAKRPTKVAVVAVGYADGYLRAASASDEKPGAQVILAGKPCPIAGRVSMDLLTVDVTDLADGAVKRGDEAILIGDEIALDDFAAHARTIAYEVLTSLGRRYHRLYRVS